MSELVLSGVRKSYPGQPLAALRGLDLTVEGGRLTALLGPSGSGKSTAMKLIAGMIEPDEGDIRLGGRSLPGIPPDRREVVMVFQNPHLFPHLTVAQNVGFGLRMRGRPRDEIARLTGAMLERVRLDGLGNRRPAELSGGQQQRAALARALVLKPKLLLLDEPLSSLDASLRDDMRALIRDLQRETGITTVVVTHDQTEAVVLADQIALILEGRLAQSDKPEVIYRRPASLAVARFFGGVNFLPGQVESGLFLSDVGPIPLPPGMEDGLGTLTIRPEAICLGPGPEARAARVTDCTFLGTQTRIGLELAGTRVEAIGLPDAVAGLSAGDMVGVTLPATALWVLRD